MMDFKSRIKNKTFVLAIITCIIAFVYQIFGILGFASPVSDDMLLQVVGLLLNLLVGLGVIVDPTTKGIVDGN